MVQRLCFVRNCYAGDTASEAARRVGVSRTTGIRWLDRWNEAGFDGLQPDTAGGGRPAKLDAAARKRLRAIVAAEGPLTTVELRDRLRSEFGVRYAQEYLPRLLRSIGLTPTEDRSGDETAGRPPLRWIVSAPDPNEPAVE